MSQVDINSYVDTSGGLLQGTNKAPIPVAKDEQPNETCRIKMFRDIDNFKDW